MSAEPNWRLAAKRQRLLNRARILTEIRAFFVAEHFLEVETPYRIPCNAPELTIQAQPCGDQVLHTSPELCMKRLLAAGYAQIFQICHCWRAAERGRRHLPEFTMLEWYRLHADYRQLMVDCEQLLCQLVPGGTLTYQGRHITIRAPFERLSLEQAFQRHAPLSLHQAMAENCFEEHYSQFVEPHLGQHRPTLLYDFPAAMAALACLKKDDPLHAERFELYVAGVEVANAFSELTDTTEQRQRFAAEEQQRRALGLTAQPLPEPFLDELQHLPAAAGIALGIDRLVMLLTDSDTIDQVVAFTPQEL